ncbi:extracellular calcium-sensing receptor-like protein [Labeo rohita]|uniref:Extracellular calcium-sensing receptor-like protein n=2 Tax=Labeo rohita TaxID=84645 RepID=A0A498N990_LABRO|nr:extracellular calcium-sensing receptor-like protein [Labeo rohita]
MMGDPKYPLLTKDGDIIIGALFAIRSKETVPSFEFAQKPQLLSCSSVNLRDFRMAQIMIFAIEEINRSKSLLPNVSIGYRIYDTCGSRLSSMSATMGLMNGPEFAAEYRCNGQSPIHAIIGETESSATVILSRTTGPFKIPVISHSASCECLSNRKDYPSFFRTIASDYHQGRALAYIVKNLGWSWVGTVNSDNDYGNNVMSIFLNTAQKEGICVEYSVKFYRTEPEKLKKAVDTIKKGTAKVIVAFVSLVEMGLLIEQLSIQNITGFQLIGGEGWITAKSLITPNSFLVLGGSLGFAFRKINIEGFSDYVIKSFWDTAFPCTKTERNSSEHALICSRYQDLLTLRNYNEDVPEQRYASNVYKAVYAVAHSLHSLLNCKEQTRCEKGLSIQPKQVVEALKRVNFTVKFGDNVWFDSTGGAVAHYEVVNWQQDSNRSFHFKPVGYFDASLPPDQSFMLNTENIIWAGGQLEINLVTYVEQSSRRVPAAVLGGVTVIGSPNGSPGVIPEPPAPADQLLGGRDVNLRFLMFEHRRTLIKDLGLEGMVTGQQASKKWQNLKKKYKDLRTLKTGLETDAGQEIVEHSTDTATSTIEISPLPNTSETSTASPTAIASPLTPSPRKRKRKTNPIVDFLAVEF